MRTYQPCVSVGLGFRRAIARRHHSRRHRHGHADLFVLSGMRGLVRNDRWRWLPIGERDHAANGDRLGAERRQLRRHAGARLHAVERATKHALHLGLVGQRDGSPRGVA
jgi:hypothetical protein